MSLNVIKVNLLIQCCVKEKIPNLHNVYRYFNNSSPGFFFISMGHSNFLKFIDSEKATKFCEISTIDLSHVVPVKSTVDISQNFVAFSELN